MAPESSVIETIAYFSASTTSWSEDELTHLLQVCRANNLSADVSGFLIYVDGSFLQWLEGPPIAVNRIFEKISLDRRHTRVSPIFKGRLGVRHFTKWSMAFIPKEDISAEVSSEIADIRALRHGGGFLTDAPRLARRVTDNFLRINRF